MSDTSNPLATLYTPTRRRTATGWAAPHVIAASPRRYLVGLGARIGALILFALADVIFIKTTIDIVLLSADAISWLVAVLLAIGAVVMAVTTGHLAHVAAAEGRRALPAHLLIIGWLALGVALVAMRFNAAAWTATPIQVEGVAAPAFDEAAMHRGMAVLLALIYLASGLWGYVEGRHLFNPFAQAYVASLLHRPALAARVISQGGLVNLYVEDLRRGRQQVEALIATRRAAENARRSLAAELMAEARVRIANSLSDPASTGITELVPSHESIVPVTESSAHPTGSQAADEVTR
jgi:hypothetical protein